jgi:hypothetical protein
MNQMGLLKRLGDLPGVETLQGEMKQVVDWVGKLRDLKGSMKLKGENGVGPGAINAPVEMDAA